VFGALREIAADRRYVRQINGRKLVWEGRVGFIGCVTEAIDELGMGDLGERFVYYRVPGVDESEELEAASLALTEGRGSHQQMRAAVAAFVEGLDVPATRPGLAGQDEQRLTLLCTFVTRCRSTVIWDRQHADSVVDIPQPERSPRLTRACAQLLHGLRLVGCDDTEAWRVVRQVALGSIRTRKRRVLAALLRADLPMVAGGIAARARTPERGVWRDLAELNAFGIVDQVGEMPARWMVAAKYRAWWADLVALGGAVDLATLRPLTGLPSFSPEGLTEESDIAGSR
jgi:hypothetical protein